MSEITMPGALLQESSNAHIKSCARCQVSQAALVVRAEHLCGECFIRYIATKVLKRLEVHKIRGTFKDPPKTLLLALSLGISSMSMLHVLDEQLCNHLQRSGRTSYKIHVLYVDQSPIIEHINYQKAIETIKERFPSHKYTTISLNDVFDYNVNFDEALIDSKVLEIHDATLHKHDRLTSLLSYLPSATSRYDIANILRLRLVTAFAKQNGCSSILYGDSTTRLAEKTLSETAKGRGSSVPYFTSDGLSINGIKTSFPMRDLLKKELATYVNLVSPPLAPLTLEIANPLRQPLSSKATTIDDLMNQYFESVEQNYPGIVANVVRTSSKLIVSSLSSSPLCIICDLPTEKRPQRWGGDQENSEIPSEADERILQKRGEICYGCARSVDKAKGIIQGG